MARIYLTCRMNLRATPSLKGKVIRILEKDQIIDVQRVVPKTEGYCWFMTTDGYYIANVAGVFYHAEDYGDAEKLKKYISTFLTQSLASTTEAVDHLKKALDTL